MTRTAINSEDCLVLYVILVSVIILNHDTECEPDRERRYLTEPLRTITSRLCCCHAASKNRTSDDLVYTRYPANHKMIMLE